MFNRVIITYIICFMVIWQSKQPTFKKGQQGFEFFHNLFFLRVMKWSSHMRKHSPGVFPTWSFISYQPAYSGQHIICMFLMIDMQHNFLRLQLAGKRRWIDEYCMCARNENCAAWYRVKAQSHRTLSFVWLTRGWQRTCIKHYINP